MLLLAYSIVVTVYFISIVVPVDNNESHMVVKTVLSLSTNHSVAFIQPFLSIIYLMVSKTVFCVSIFYTLLNYK